jgi:hypothetical protein
MELLSVFGDEQRFLAVWSDSFAVFPAAPWGSVSA